RCACNSGAVRGTTPNALHRARRRVAVPRWQSPASDRVDLTPVATRLAHRWSTRSRCALTRTPARSLIADYACPHELPSVHGKAPVRNVAIARRLRRRRGRYALHAAAEPGGVSSLRRRRRRPRRRHLWPAYLRGDALLGRRSAGVECGGT